MDLLKQKEVENLLKEVYRYRNFPNSVDAILNIMRSYSLKKSDFDGINPKDTSKFFSKWSKCTRDTLFNKSRLNGKNYSTDKWWGIRTEKYDWNSDDNYKIYLPLDYNHLEKGIEILIDFFKTNNIQIDMKVAHEMRSDNVIIRVTGYEDALKIINFVEHNNYLVEGRNKVLPIVPNFNTVGLVTDKGENSTYHGNIACDIADYIKKNDSDCTYNNFVNYLKKQVPHNTFNKDMENHFGYRNEYLKKDNVVKEIKDNNINEKINYLTKAMYHTYIKYHDELQVETALVSAINNDYSFFTRNSNSNDSTDVRKELQEHVKPEEIRRLMMYILDSKGISIDSNMTNQQLAFLLSNSLVPKHQELIEQRKL